jgi:hypothetical protein
MSDVFAVADKVLNRLVVEQKRNLPSETIHTPRSSCECNLTPLQLDSKTPVVDAQSTKIAFELMKPNSATVQQQNKNNNKIGPHLL